MMMVVLIASCQNRPKEVLNRKQMERVLYDVYVAEATMENDYQNFNTPEKKEDIHEQGVSIAPYHTGAMGYVAIVVFRQD